MAGFIMEEKDLKNQEAWYRAFRSWCSDNGLRFMQEFFVIKYPYYTGNLNDIEPQSAPDCIQKGWSLLSRGQAKKIVIQRHIPASQAADFNCWVLDTESKSFE